jgi:hypothetical protein
MEKDGGLEMSSVWTPQISRVTLQRRDYILKTKREKSIRNYERGGRTAENP